MTPGKKYELFTSTTTKITDKSSFSAYYSLYGVNTDVYRTGYKHVLTSNYVLPENTKLTLIDLSLDDPSYYYYIVTAADVTAWNTELSTYHEVTIPFSKFKMMDTVGNNHYDDATMNALYYRANIGSYEEFIVQIDLIDTTIADDELNKYLYPELQDASGNMIISALAIERPQLQFSIYTDSASSISATASLSSNPIYDGSTAILEVESTFTSEQEQSDTIYDTTYYDDHMGLLIYLTREKEVEGVIVDEKVSGNALMGSYFSISYNNGNTIVTNNYYPDANGETRLKFADKVGNIKSYITVNLTNAVIPTGDYTMHIEIFGSSDGIHYSNDSFKQIGYETLDVRIVLSGYGLKATLSNDSIVIVNDGQSKNLSGTVEYTSILTNPNIRLRMYRRDYSEEVSTSYNVVNLQTYIDETLTISSVQNSYMLIPHPARNNSFILPFKTNN